MKLIHALLVLTAGTLGASCTSIDRSRDLADPAVPAKTLAQQVCSNCHGIDGRSINPNFPNLAAQPPAYFIAQLKQYRGQNRLDPAGFEYMWGLSRHLTDEQIEGLATYYAEQKITPPSGSEDAALVAEGKTIFETGLADKNVPPCNTCHGDKGMGNEQFPRIAYQHADYLVKQLMVFQRTDERPEGSIMKTIAHDMTRQNMEAVAAYLQESPAK